MQIKIFCGDKSAVFYRMVGAGLLWGSLMMAPSISNSQEPMALRGPSFVPDTKMDGAGLNGWEKLGAAEWKAEGGGDCRKRALQEMGGSCWIDPFRMWGLMPHFAVPGPVIQEFW